MPDTYEHRAISDYGFLSDCRSAALVSSEGSIDWLCAPRFDSPSLFARLLDADAGYWSVGAAGVLETTRRYVESTMVLETTLRTADGTLRLTDAMALGRSERGHRLAAHSPGVILREALCVEGEVVVDMVFAPRPEYGLVMPLIVRSKNALVARGGGDVVSLFLPSSFEIAIDGATARGQYRLRKGRSLAFALQHCNSIAAVPKPWRQAKISARLRDTKKSWQSWSRLHQSYTGPWQHAVHLSGRVLQALTYTPTGAVVAAPTTSLPETIGGANNWDYRYTWLRDANLTLEALWVAACPDEVQRFFAWIAHAAASNADTVNIMYGVGGESDLTERELSHLRGYRDSAPVRVGNDAWKQHQLDVYGHMLDGVRRFSEYLKDMEEPTKRFLVACADTAAARWNEPGSGIWEIRGEPKHYVYSKVMCWVALDAALGISTLVGADSGAIARWRREREAIRSEILEYGYDAGLEAFVQSFGERKLDAATLIIPIVGFLPATDPRVRSTIEAVERELSDPRGLLYRYQGSGGNDEAAGAFLLCAFWLAHAIALAGDKDRAIVIFERALACGNDLGLLSEETDAHSGAALGNFPQAFSHVGLVNAAFAIANAT